MKQFLLYLQHEYDSAPHGRLQFHTNSDTANDVSQVRVMLENLEDLGCLEIAGFYDKGGYIDYQISTIDQKASIRKFNQENLALLKKQSLLNTSAIIVSTFINPS